MNITLNVTFENQFEKLVQSNCRIEQLKRINLILWPFSTKSKMKKSVTFTHRDKNNYQIRNELGIKFALNCQRKQSVLHILEIDIEISQKSINIVAIIFYTQFEVLIDKLQFSQFAEQLRSLIQIVT